MNMGAGSNIYQWPARLPDPAQHTIINIKSLIAHELHAKPQIHRKRAFRYLEAFGLDGDISLFGKSRNRTKLRVVNE
jgi:hypothetical protein